MTKFRILTILFKQDLSEAQEATLLANLESTRTRVYNKLLDAASKARSSYFIRTAGGEVLPQTIEAVASRVALLVRVVKVSQREYQYKYVYDKAALIRLHVLNHNIRAFELVGEDQIKEGLRRHVFPLQTQGGYPGIGVNEGDYEFKTSEVEEA